MGLFQAQFLRRLYKISSFSHKIMMIILGYKNDSEIFNGFVTFKHNWAFVIAPKPNFFLVFVRDLLFGGILLTFRDFEMRKSCK